MSFYTNMQDYLKTTQALNPAIILDMCRLDEGEDELPVLTTAAAATDIIKDKEVVDGNGDLLTGTREIYGLTCTVVTPEGFGGSVNTPDAFISTNRPIVTLFGDAVTAGNHYVVVATTGEGEDLVTIETTTINFTYTNATITNGNGMTIALNTLPAADVAVTITITVVAD